MSTLDEKLRWTLKGVRGVGLSDENATLEIAQIKQAFRESDWVEFTDEYMTGQEWYSRFEKELKKPRKFRANTEAEAKHLLEQWILESARKAAGLEPNHE